MAYVGDVSHIPHLVAQMLQVPENNVKIDGTARMPQVCLAIDSRATQIHTHQWGIQRHEVFFLAGKGVVDFELTLHGTKLRD